MFGSWEKCSAPPGQPPVFGPGRKTKGSFCSGRLRRWIPEVAEAESGGGAPDEQGLEAFRSYTHLNVVAAIPSAWCPMRLPVWEDTPHRPRCSPPGVARAASWPKIAARTGPCLKKLEPCAMAPKSGQLCATRLVPEQGGASSQRRRARQHGASAIAGVCGGLSPQP